MERGLARQVLLGDLRRLEDRPADRALAQVRLVLVAADPVGLVLLHRGRVEPHPVGAQAGDEVDAAGGAGQPAEGVRAEPGVEGVVLRAVVPEGEADLLEHHALGPLADREMAEDLLGLRVGVIHVALDPAEDRLRAEHVDRHLGLAGHLDRLFEVGLVVADLVGHDDDHRVVAASCASL